MEIRCQICQGNIGSGEPVVPYEDGLAHRFRTTCEWYVDQRKLYQEEYGSIPVQNS